MVDNMLIKDKVAMLAYYHLDLEELRDISLKEFQTDKKMRRYVERTLHLAIECCLDIGSNIIADNGWREPNDNKDIFSVLQENSVLSIDEISELQKLDNIRDLLVHGCTKKDSEMVCMILNNNLADIQRFIGVIDALLR